MEKIRVLVVDDSAFMRKVISDILSSNIEIEIIGTARNGMEAIQKIQDLRPDVMTLDIEMPVMNGIETLKMVMKTQPLPVIMISSLTQEGATATFEALELGAVDFIPKPSGPISLDIHKVQEQIIGKVIAASKARILGKQTKFSHGNVTPAAPPVKMEPLLSKKSSPNHIREQRSPSGIPHLIAIGSSTGGPNALQQVLKNLPKQLNAAIFIVQHMPPGFTKSLSERLNSLCEIQVVEAEDGMIAKAGYAYIAPGSYHMEVKDGRDGELVITLNQREPKSGHRPSVDVLFDSLAKVQHVSKFAVILTGMGSDGTNGLKNLKETGCKEAIAEDASTCVVFGMPRAAISSGNIDTVLPLFQIGSYLTKITNNYGKL
ncbi:protein-glutamate methylesterase/protein-glutamine glutaminase [Ammoniphilus resinae]|uniref:Protein-glutamate methylesterase/protein-glutamine glutaminase n=1 Tax=Ammoniphilus resinae TaxID=861532 RepID=A0ABS4GMM5_9BACL|nr:chemotaxis response regulator protein-glutamate methylesterase [Ammoniphilus resinae]MBP1931514.1 two-component system chemotaxis response regulator CheB [Ammoniphilus resinae]